MWWCRRARPAKAGQSVRQGRRLPDFLLAAAVALATLGAGGAIDTETAKQPIIGSSGSGHRPAALPSDSATSVYWAVGTPGFT